MRLATATDIHTAERFAAKVVGCIKAVAQP